MIFWKCLDGRYTRETLAIIRMKRDATTSGDIHLVVKLNNFDRKLLYMITNEQMIYFDRILSSFNKSEAFSITDYIRPLLSSSEFNSLNLDLELEPQIMTLSDDITYFLVDKGFAMFEGPANQNVSSRRYRSRLIKLTEKGIQLIVAGSYRIYAKDEIQEKNQLLRIDWILNFMAMHAVQGIGIEDAWRRIVMQYPSIHDPYLESYRQQIIDKLKADEYLKYDESNGTCIVTFKGVIFNESGGYQNEKFQKDLEKLRAKRMYQITWILGIGVIIPSIHDLVEICQHRTSNIDLPVLTNLFVFLSILVMGLIIGFLIQGKQKHENYNL